MKGSSLQELLKLTQQIMIQQQLKIATLLSIVEELARYSKQKKDNKLRDIIDSGLKKMSALENSSKLTALQMKTLKQKIEQENKQEAL